MTAAALVIAFVLLLFGNEPAQLNSGKRNVLADLPLWTGALAVVGSVPFVLAVARRPRVAANHFALIVRPGWIRTLVLPWSRLAEVTVAELNGERYLLIRCGTGLDRMGNTPRWLDQTVLRALVRDGFRRGQQFDLAVRLRDFAPGVDGQMGAIAAFAPDHVLVANNP